MWQYVYTDELYHYGVKGMKWGVRRAQKKLNKLASNPKAGEAERKLAERRLSEAKAKSKDKALRSTARKERNARLVSNGKEFMNKYGKTLVKVAVASTAVALGAPYISNIVNGLIDPPTINYNSLLSGTSKLDPQVVENLNAWNKTVSDLKNTKVIDLDTREVRNLF